MSSRTYRIEATTNSQGLDDALDATILHAGKVVAEAGPSVSSSPTLRPSGTCRGGLGLGGLCALEGLVAETGCSHDLGPDLEELLFCRCARMAPDQGN